MRHHIWYVAVGLLLPALAVSEQRSKVTLDSYRTSAEVAILLCEFRFDAAVLGGTLLKPTGAGDDYPKCIEEAKKELRRDFEALYITLKKPAAKAALKIAHIQVVTSLNLIMPDFSERVIDYEQRRLAMRAKRIEAWSRLDVE